LHYSYNAENVMLTLAVMAIGDKLHIIHFSQDTPKHAILSEKNIFLSGERLVCPEPSLGG